MKNYEKEERIESLMEYIYKEKSDAKTIIFTQTKRQADQG